MRNELWLRSTRVLTPAGRRPATVRLIDGVIGEVLPHDANVPRGALFDQGDLVLLPGLVDTHVHINEPGRTEWEGFATATAAARAGGILSLVDMPLNSSPVTTTVAALEAKRAAAKGKCAVEVAFWGGVVSGNAAELEPLAQAGVRGFKCFMVHSGIDDFPAAHEATLREAMPILARLGLPLLAHAEVAIPPPRAGVNPRRYADYGDSRPPHCEVEAVELLLRLVRETGCRVHVVHVAAAEVLPLLEAAHREGLPVTAETCPHYLALCAEEIPDGATQYKCAPPVRSRLNREALWGGLRSGLLQMVVSDHSPCPPALKLPDEGDFSRAWGGIASLQFGLPIMWTEANRRGFTVEDVVRWMATEPARLAGWERTRGAIAPGFTGGVIAFDPDATWTIREEDILHRHKVTPYLGREVRGVVRGAWGVSPTQG